MSHTLESRAPMEHSAGSVGTAGPLFWLSDEAWAAIEPRLPQNQRGAKRADDRRVISGVVHVLRNGQQWKDCPSSYGPAATIYTRWRRWNLNGTWRRILSVLPEGEAVVGWSGRALRTA